MSPRTPGPTEPVDRSGGPDRIADLLGGLGDGVAAPPPGSPLAARRTASRRQGVRVAGAVAAVAAVMIGLPLGVSAGGTQAAPVSVATEQPAPTVQPPSRTPAVVPEPSAPAGTPAEVSVPPVAPSDAPATDRPASDPTSTPAATPRTTPAAEPVAVLAVTPSGSAAVTAGELEGVDIATGERALEDVPPSGGASWALDPCAPTAWPLDRARTGWASARWWLGDAGGTREAAVFATEVEAVQALDAFRRVADACFASPADAAEGLRWQDTTPPGQEATVFAGLLRDFDPPDENGWGPRDGGYWVALREGRTVVLVSATDHYSGGVIAAYQGDTREGAGGGIGEGTQEEAAATVRERLAGTRDTAQAVLDAVAVD